MKNTRLSIQLCCAFLIFLAGCVKRNEDIKVLAWIPVYGESADFKIKVEDPRPVTTLERIYVFQQYIFAIERSQGVHVIDNSNPESPVPVHFLSIPGTTEVAIRDQYLYTDQFDELIVLDIHDIAQALELKRVEHVFPNSKNIPDRNSGYFRCPEPGKTVAGWIRDSISQPDCFN